MAMDSAYSEYGILWTLGINKIKFHKIPHTTGCQYMLPVQGASASCQYELLSKLHFSQNFSVPYNSVTYKL
jgi:hypothetical protein